MKKRTNLTILVIALIFEVIIISAFFLFPVTTNALTYTSLACLAVSNLVFFGVIWILTGQSNLFTKAGTISAATLYFFFQIFVNLAAWAAPGMDVGKFVFGQIISTGFLIVAILLFWLFGAKIQQSNLETKRKLENGEYNTPKRGGF